MADNEDAPTRLVTLLSAVSATGAGSSSDLGDMRDEFSLVVTTTGSPTFSVTFQGSVDGSDWFTLGSAVTSVTNGTTVTGTLARYVRANLTALSGGTLTAELAFSLALGLSAGGGGPGTTVTAADTSIVVGGTSSAVTLATGTLDVIATQHAPAAAWSNNNKKITLLANGSLSTDAAAFGQIPVLDTTATDIQALGTQAAGNSTKAAAANHVHPDLNLYLAPSGATAESFPRRYATASQSVGSTGVLYVCGIAMAAGIVVNNITMLTGGTAKTGGSHGWYVLLDSGLVVRAVTGDQTDPATVWGATTTSYPLATNAYTTTYTGLYYIGVMVAATGMPQFLGSVAPPTSVNGLTPLLAGTSSISQTTAPATGTTMTALSNSARQFYAYTS